MLYEGKHARFTTLVSVGRDRLGDPKTSASTALGTFEVTAKHITDKTQNELELGTSYQVYDVPWVLELSSGQALHAAYWHDRFGIEHSPGAVHLSPADAARIWRWADPALPEGWHSAKALADSPKTLVNIRK